MAITVQRWSGREVRVLRKAKRMSLREFAGHLGISERMVSKWEAGGENLVPRPVNQSALDTSLAASSQEVQERFARELDLTADRPAGPGPAVKQSEVNDEVSTPAGDENHIRHPIDGKLMTLVEAGVFFAGDRNEPIYLPAFYMDIYPTTNADYARYVAATQANAPQHWLDGSPPANQLSHPVVFVTWRDADSYCRWAGKELPTSHQWEKAARGTRGDIYPWGSQRTPAKCNCRESGIRSTTPVSTYASGVSQYGVYDLCGNVWEWCATGSTTGRYELKGSAFTSPFLRCTPSIFNDASADMLDDDTGFRCAASVDSIRRLLGGGRGARLIPQS
ncbi:SUMF1/EgtB/PvdO family nonheme iron enzyme [Micromonospora sp. Llam7]|uniref:SUMF1/EgtB/PvdO family nonheme iron enzyme n=1 Tax=Micromonospora tarapacensis TaxID=2835305 RepID=UPI001C8377E8|nr:SUMF1/EgtB/PvdO family nonheme iron enzyme [Micromonospora tarapacensis]MBX7264780.1 SUMF1/EgtB/PvdO family nonheme iron enzyme [Micromonospora tarapacensis]